eukprot:Transcript_1847.p3 GENE.Transcript_1847~~Transcript_1847.p3  ORF type:complete len:140 (+),score=76.76 Transcript_1847:148-567(+)
MPKKGGKKGKGKKKEEDWGTIAREQYVTIEMRNSKWQSMRFKNVLAISEPIDLLRQMVIDEHRLGGSQGLKLFLGELNTDDALIKPEDYTQPISSLQVPCGTKNDQIIQVVTYSYEPFASILNIPREVTPAPMKPYEVF